MRFSKLVNLVDLEIFKHLHSRVQLEQLSRAAELLLDIVLAFHENLLFLQLQDLLFEVPAVIEFRQAWESLSKKPNALQVKLAIADDDVFLELRGRVFEGIDYRFLFESLANGNIVGDPHFLNIEFFITPLFFFLYI